MYLIIMLTLNAILYGYNMAEGDQFWSIVNAFGVAISFGLMVLERAKRP